MPRAPDETGGDYWRVLPEGTIEGYDGVTIADEPEHEALDFGANFPGDRGTTASQTDGTYPTSEPEVAAYVAAIARRPNIVAHVTCHTFGGLVLTPPVNLSEPLPEPDRLRVRNAGRKGGGAHRVHRDFLPGPAQRGSRDATSRARSAGSTTGAASTRSSPSSGIR